MEKSKKKTPITSRSPALRNLEINLEINLKYKVLMMQKSPLQNHKLYVSGLIIVDAIMYTSL